VFLKGDYYLHIGRLKGRFKGCFTSDLLAGFAVRATGAPNNRAACAWRIVTQAATGSWNRPLQCFFYA
jgi:hypothetical protein